MELKELEIYKLSREISVIAWKVYEQLPYGDKKIFGDQFMRATDSISANIAEGFGRFHYLDKNKFNYNARGSLLESIHWLEVMEERNRINEESYGKLTKKLALLKMQLNSYISSTKEQVQKQA